MITEIAKIDVKPGSEKEFEAAVAKAGPIFKRCKGWKSFE
ncbi:MAG TPA: antibiotic biosynthesis monooxygenase, partial [Bradyrhizobium sp.]|nr:antibiotic biosynthesis monooxygenase [Bradyrhizobium sp.]